MRLVYFGGTPLPTASEDVNLPISARSNLIPLDNGGYDEDGQPTVLQPNTITRTFKITPVSDATMDNLMKVFVSGRKILKQVLRDNTTYRQTFAKVVTIDRQRNANDVSVQRLGVTFRQDYPFWMATTDEPRYLDNGEVLDAGWNLDGNYTSITINATQETATITNSGIVPIRRGKIVVRPGSGASITNLTITNQTNWNILRYVGTLAYPDVLVLDLLAKSAKINATNAYGDILIPSGQMDWQVLEVGANAIVLDVAAQVGNTAFEWHWAKHYV